MSYIQILFDLDARQRILKGASTLADAIRITLGPKSKSVLIQKKSGEPIVCNDGVTIAREVFLKDPEEQLGAAMLKQAAIKTGDSVGDGTSTATVLAHAILAEGMRNIVAGASGIDLKRGLEMALPEAVDALAKQSREVNTTLEKAQVATISAHNNAHVGQLVADAIERVGDDGVITVEASRTTETVVDVVDGMQLDRGYISPYFVNDAEKMQVVLEDAYVFISDRKLSSLNDILPLLEALAKTGRPVLFIAQEVEGEALAALVVNQIRGVLHNAAIKAPGFGDRRMAMLQDVAVLTGATVISEDLGSNLKDVTIDHLGTASRIVIDKEHTTLVGGGGTRSEIDERIQHLRHDVKEASSDYDREKCEERLARLAGGVAVIRVGALTEVEMASMKEAFDDAISATRAAVQEGMVPGGGLALLRCIPRLSGLASVYEGDEKTGVRILMKALEAPARQIARNSAVDDGVVIARMLESEGSVGFDAETTTYVDLVEKGIVDPAQVARLALENAVSVASTLLLTEATMTEIDDEPVERAALGEYPM